MFARFRSWSRAAFRRGRMEADMAREIEAHIEHRTQDLMVRGFPRAEAERRARVEFGASEAYKEECREALGLRLADELSRNIRYALRHLRKTPAFTLTAVLTLALCIGANTIIFSLVDTVLLRPLPYPDPERLALLVLNFRGPRGEGLQESQTGAIFELVRDKASSLESAAEGMASGVNLAAEGHVEYIRQNRVSAGYFSVLGIPPMIGREFTREEDTPSGPAVVVLSHALWQRIFNGNPGVLNQAILLRGEPYTVVGIMPPEFKPSTRADLWTPLRPNRTGEGGGSNYQVIARLRPNVTWVQGEANLDTLSQGAPELPAPRDTVVRLGLLPLQTGSTLGIREILFVLWGAVATVLLIGCVNIAGLLLARGARRTREIGTRMALGGGRGALIRQLLTESLVLALIGGACGLALAYVGLEAMAPHLRSGLGISEAVHLDWRVLAATGVFTLITAVVFGLFPAWHASRLDIRTALVEGGGYGVIGARGHWPRRILLVMEVALGVLLLVGATQFTRTFLQLAGLTPGFDAEGISTASLSLQDARYKEANKVNTLFEDTVRRIRALPGVTDAAVALSLPYQRALNMPFRVVDGAAASDEFSVANFTYVTPGYFDTLRIPVLRGRGLRDGDGASAPRVAVVNLAFTKRYLPDQEAVGTHLRMGREGNIEIVGVVGDVLQRAGWGNYGPMGAIPGVYFPAAQTTDEFVQLVHVWFQPHWMVRTAGSNQGLVAGMQQALAQSDPMLPFSGFSDMGEVRGEALERHRFEATLVDSFAALALLLTAIGIGGLISSSVAERWREMGVRLALGATHGQALRAAATPGLVLTTAGLILGSLLAYPAMKAIQSQVWGIQPADPVNYLVTTMVLLVVAAVASFAPTLRLKRLNLADTLREG